MTLFSERHQKGPGRHFYPKNSTTGSDRHSCFDFRRDKIGHEVEARASDGKTVVVLQLGVCSEENNSSVIRKEVSSALNWNESRTLVATRNIIELKEIQHPRIDDELANLVDISEESDTLKQTDMPDEELGSPTATDWEDWEELHDLQRRKLDYGWQDIKLIESRRREILRRVDKPFWRILRYWEGTCLRVLSRDFLVWGCLAIYGVIRIQAHTNGLPEYIRALGNSNIDVVGGFLSFFLVLFCNQCNARFFEQYNCSMECVRRIYDLSGLATTGLPQAHAMRMIRYMNAAHLVGYIGLSDTYTKKNMFDAMNPSYKLLTEQEVRRIDSLDMNNSSDAFRELTTWTLEDVITAQKEGLIEGRDAGEMRDKVLKFRSAMESIYDYHDQPVHFYYIHFLSLLTVIYCPLFAISTGYSAGTGDEVHWSSDFLSGMIVFVQCIFVVGLRLLGQRLLDPYGDDLEDLSVLHYVQEAWISSQRMLSTEFPTPLDPDAEIRLAQASKSVGLPWDATLRKRTTKIPSTFA